MKPKRAHESSDSPSREFFEVTQAVEGGYDARDIGYSIFTQGEDWANLKEMVLDGARCHFADGHMPRIVRIYLVKDGLSAV